jgi:hypothetical protein
MKTLKELYLRLLAKTPKFFKNLQRIFIAIGVFGTSLAAYQQFMNDLLPQWLLPFCFITSAIGSFMAQLTVESKEELNEKLDNK